MAWREEAKKLQDKYGVSTQNSSGSGNASTSGGYQEKTGWRQNAAELFKKYSPEKREERLSQVNSWLDRYNQVMTGLSDFDKKRNGGYTTDVSGGYGEEISALLQDFGGFREYLGGLGMANATRYATALQELQEEINDGNQFMAQFGSEEAFNQYITEREDYESKRTANIAELEQELAELEKQYREQKSVADQYQRLYEGTSWLTQKRYPEEYEALRQKGSVSLADLEADITDRKAFLEEARAIQEQEPLMAKYGGKSYRELQDIISTMNPSDREYQWVNAYAEAVMGKDDYAEEILKNTAELKYLEEGLQKIQGLADQMNMGGETEADKRKYKALVQKYGSLEDLKAEIEALELKNWKYQNALKYGYLDENADYQEQAVQASDVKKVGVGIGFGTKWWGFGGDPVYHYINDIDGTRKAQQDQDGGTPYSVYDFMTDKHIADYNYLYNTQGKKAAQEYLEYIQYDLEHMQMQQLKKDTARLATEHPFASSSLSIPTNLASGLGVLDVAAQNLAREITGEYKPIHYERGSMAPTAFTTTTRSTVAQNIADATGIIDLNEEDHPFLSRVLNGKSLGDVYQLGMSMADSAAVAGLSLAGIPGGTALLGGSAASQGVLDALERGANDTQALSMGVLNGTFEMLFEEVSLDKLLNGRTGSIVKDILQQGGVEGSEEFFTTLANTAADILVMADKSDYKAKIAKYKEQGLDEKQATIKALEDIAIGMGWDFVGGLISGGAMVGMSSAGSSVIGAMRNPEIGWHGAADLAKQKNLNVMETLSEAGLQGSEALAKASTHTYAQSFQQALKNGATFDQALKQATADTAMETITWQVPLKDLLDDIKGDPKKARTEIDKALKRQGIQMTPVELQWLGAVAAEASFLQYDANFYKKIALEMMTGMDYETAHAVASRKAWQEAAREMSVIEIPDRVPNVGETYGEAHVHSQELQQEYMEFKKVLGEDAPKTLEDFGNLKYNDPDGWERIKEYRKYKERVPEASGDDFDKYLRVKATGEKGIIRIPPAPIDASGLAFRDAHAAHHGCTEEQAQGFVKNAYCAIYRERWDGISANYFSADGAAYIDIETMKIKTSFPKEKYDPHTKAIVEVFE